MVTIRQLILEAMWVLNFKLFQYLILTNILSLNLWHYIIILSYLFFQFLNVYAPKFETGGKFWPIVHNSTIFSLVLMHIIAIGIFGIKKLPLASSLTIPLPVLTLIFNEYCQKRFLPIFKAYPTEVQLWTILSIQLFIFPRIWTCL